MTTAKKQVIGPHSEGCLVFMPSSSKELAVTWTTEGMSVNTVALCPPGPPMTDIAHDCVALGGLEPTLALSFIFVGCFGGELTINDEGISSIAY